MVMSMDRRAQDTRPGRPAAQVEPAGERKKWSSRLAVSMKRDFCMYKKLVALPDYIFIILYYIVLY